jgi:tRNA-2-methylthio-N6-dimethylallyladenosine synthase
MGQTTREEQRTFYIETYGCQMNIAESHVLDSSFLKEGFRAALHPEEADIVILNTCSVRKTAENRIWGRIGFYKHLKQSRPLTLIITGCMAERLGDELIKKEPAVDLVIGTNDKTDLMHFLMKDKTISDEYSFAETYYNEGDLSSFVPIMNGCNNFCTYCIVPYVRGREVSRSYKDIIEEIDMLESKGVKEITLLGQNVNSYSYHDEEIRQTIDFPGLLSMILKHVSTIQWIRFISAHPKDFSEELIHLIAAEERICSHIHLPLQSGSDTVLQAMNRNYSSEDYYGIVSALRALQPSVTFTTDIMVGFPGETEKDFEDTLDMMRRVGYIDAYMYYYNPREGTASTRLPNQIPDSMKLERLQRVIDLQKELSASHKRMAVGSTVNVLCDDVSKRDRMEYVGHTEHGERIVFKKDDSVHIGEMLSIKVTELVGNTYKGEIICPGKQ